MGVGSSPGTSKGRLLAFRIAGWVLGISNIGFSLVFVASSLVSDDPVEQSHRFHTLGGIAGTGLIGLYSIRFAMRPEWTAMFHVLVGQAVAWAIGGLMGGDVVSGFWITGAVGSVILVALHPDPRGLLRSPIRPNMTMLTYSLVAAAPAWIYAVTSAELQHGPATDPHVELHHWSGVAVAALSIVAAMIGASLRGAGWQAAAAVAAAAAVMFGLTGLVFADLPGAPGSAWSAVAIAGGVVFWILGRIGAVREPSRT